MKRQKGFSLIEATVAMGLAATAGVVYMKHMHNVAKTDARNKVKYAMDQLEAEAANYLKSRSVCNANALKAFRGMSVSSAQNGSMSGRQTYAALTDRPFTRTDGVVIEREIFKVGDLYDSGRIHVKDVDYKIKNLIDIDQPGSPWQKSGDLQISVKFETCRKGGAVYFRSDDGVTAAICDEKDRHVIAKNFNTHAALRLSGSTVSDITCADSQDALVEASKEYADMKSCVTLAKTMILTGTQGSTECGVQVSYKDNSRAFTQPGTGFFNLPENYLPNSLMVELIGGGGGGGGGGRKFAGDRKSGGGGHAGEYVMTQVNATEKGCSFVVGRGGNGGSTAENGGRGTESKIMCGLGFQLAAAGGGGGGARAQDESCGKPGADIVYLGQVVSSGSPGRCNNASNSRRGDAGAGGGGGGEKHNVQGNHGGHGRVRLVWRELVVKDPNGILAKIGTCTNALMGGACDGREVASTGNSSSSGGANNGGPSDIGGNPNFEVPLPRDKKLGPQKLRHDELLN